MNECPDGWALYRKKSTESTNDDVAMLLRKGLDRVAVISEVQTRGRGRKGNYWYSPLGGVWLSLGLFTDTPARDLVTPLVNQLSKALGDKYGLPFETKLPNDLFLNGKKVMGVLMETTIQNDRILQIILGMGLNVINPIPDEISDLATSLSQEGVKTTVEDAMRLIFETAANFLEGLAQEP